jgi:hypothetical protein
MLAAVQLADYLIAEDPIPCQNPRYGRDLAL